ncbi:HAMP domain-containing histidine kinase [Ktedonosporobacter rubrisoli]|uniref:histidine kinase n=1 Tax=Ktedonosporobacter rubrisoli TaxID=2509675 RepID=A0A4V0YYD9_KTERU|nr:HAMP domain-containing sensor histidine kinase [Ktedonosporobacter rubrisoli]QBD75881.1 HAMP domain-containing histidine kinase [Ktedonosporobacter rubrisoli]
MKRVLRQFLRALVSFIMSVRLRLTLWNVAVMAVILVVIGGSLYASQTYFNSNTSESRIQTQLYTDTQQLENVYKQALLSKATPASQKVTRSSDDEVVLLLGPDNTVLDTRGTLSRPTIQLLQGRSEAGQSMIDLTINTPHSTNQWHNNNNNNYRFLITPLLEKNARIATLIVGLALPRPMNLMPIWFFHALLGLLATFIGGYWLAGKMLRPVKMITHAAREINATDLRRRLHLRRHDEFGELAATFDQMLARLEAAFKRQTQFTADASHELRTPLTIIDLELNRALTQLSTPEEYRQVLEQLQAENEQMTTIVNSLLLLARADTGQITLQLEELDLSDLTLASVERLLPLAQQSQVSLATGELPELLVNGDPHYLSRMLMNLIENAIKYTSGVGTHVRVELSCKDEHWGVVRVQDDGPGIDDEHLPFLFDRFYRVDKARTRSTHRLADGSEVKEEPGGTGLGLAIVQWIVHAHNGEIIVESETGKGSVFEVRLPLLNQEQEATPKNDRSMTKKCKKVHVSVIQESYTDAIAQ